MNVTGTIKPGWALTESIGFGSFPATNLQSKDVPSYVLINGSTGAGKIDDHWETVPAGVTLAASASVTYTLSALTDAIGRTVAYEHLVGLLLTILSITPGDYLTLAPGASHGFVGFGTAAINVKRAFLMLDDTGGFPVVASTTDQITITNAGSDPITFDLKTIGTTG